MKNSQIDVSNDSLVWFLARVLHGIHAGTLGILERKDQPPEAGNGCVE